MKKLIILSMLLLAAFAYGLDKTVTLPIINQHDQSAVRLEIYRIHTGDKTIWTKLFDADGTMIEDKRVYSYARSYKNIPVILLDSEIALLDKQDPAEWWDIKTIRLWLDSKQAKDEDGKVLADDPYRYEGGDSKSVLLDKITGG